LTTTHSILITGGRGFIGTHVIDELRARGYAKITVLDAHPHEIPRDQSQGQLEQWQLDINDPKLDEAFAAGRFTAVIHLAALHHIPYCNRHPGETWRVNVGGTRAVLGACVRYEVPHVFVASSAVVYRSSSQPHRESDRLEARDIYSLTKLVNEHQARDCASAGVRRLVVGRIFNAVGRHDRNPHLVPELVRRLRQSDCIEVGDADARRDYVDARDIARAIVQLTFSGPPGLHTFNIGTGRAYSVREVAETLARLAGRQVKLVASERLRRPTDRPVLVADRERVRRECGWEPVYSLEDSLRAALED
jgi:UDP-glucose 4-epimerase